jgi:hypothetical protein
VAHSHNSQKSKTTGYMRNRLPGIQIRIKEDHHKFLEQMQHIVLRTKDFQAKYHNGFRKQDLDILSVSHEVPNVHVGLVGQFIATNNKPKIVRVEMRAERWNPAPASYETYVESAKQLIKPLLQLYNSAFHTQYHLLIESAESLKPKLPPRASQRFQEFVDLANKQILHPLDWERFYYFIYACSSRSVKTTQEDMKEILLASGFSDEDSEDLANIFWHGVSLLRLGKR